MTIYDLPPVKDGIWTMTLSHKGKKLGAYHFGHRNLQTEEEVCLLYMADMKARHLPIPPKQIEVKITFTSCLSL
jgi:hypothetical protein